MGAHYLLFAFSCGMRMFISLAAILMFGGVVIAHYFPELFSLGAWVRGLTLFVFAWIGRATVQREARSQA